MCFIQSKLFDNRYLYLYIIIFLLCISLSCKNNNSSGTDIKGKPIVIKETVELKWIGHWQGEGLKEQMVKDIAREFEFENQDIKVTLKFPEELYLGNNRADNNAEYEFNRKNITSDKSEWDIIRINHDSSLRQVLNDPKWALKYLEDVSQVPEIANSLIPAVLTPKYKSSWSGILPGPPLDATNYVLFCNTEVAKEIGIDIKQFDMTYDDFLSYIKAVHEYNKSHNKNLIAIMDNSDWSMLDVIAQQLFCSEIGDYNTIINNKYSDNKLAAFKKVIQSFWEIGQYDPLPSDFSKYKWSTSLDVILTNRCLFYPQGMWMYNIWKARDSLMQKRIIPVQLPGYKKAQTYLGDYRTTWAIPKNSPHKNEAIRLMKYISRPEIADKWVRYTKSPTSIKGSIVTTTMGFDSYENFDYIIAKNYQNTKVEHLLNFGFYLGIKNERLGYVDWINLARRNQGVYDNINQLIKRATKQ